MTNLALFDLDHTLISGDSDFLWGCFLSEKSIVGHEFKKQHSEYLRQYNQGVLDIYEFLSFTLEPLTRFSFETLSTMHAVFMSEKIMPIIRPSAYEWITKHKEKGDVVVMVTATNDFIAAPIAKHFKMDHLIATTVCQEKGRFIARIEGPPCFKTGKIERLKSWIEAQKNVRFEHMAFYSDSYNDLPLLEYVDKAIVVTPDKKLRDHAVLKNWQIIDVA